MAKPPKSIPQPIREGYTGSYTRQPSRFQMEDNQYRTRRETSRRQFNYSLTWKLNWAQLDLFEAWVEYDLAQGKGYFEIEFAGKTISVRPTTGMPTVNPVGDKWSVKMDVEELRAAPIVAPKSAFLPTWPSSLPEFESAEYMLSKVGAVTKSDIDFGVSDMRVRFQQRLTQYGGKIYLNQAQRDAFWDYYQNSLIDGFAWFLAPFVNSKSQTKLKARFIENPVETPLNSWYSISVKLETTKAPIMAFADYEATKLYVNTYVEAGYVEYGYVGEQQ